MINSILVITPNYPIEGEQVYPFVKNLCDQFVKMGKEITILSPQSVTSLFRHRKKKRPTEWIDKGSNIKVFQPYYFTVSHSCHDVNNFLLRTSVSIFFKKHKKQYDIIYCHFWSSAYAILPYARSKHLPLYVATGESVIKKLFSSRFGIKELRDYIKGVICVSTKNKSESIALGLTTEEKCIVIPNAINSNQFYKRDKGEMRKELGIPRNAFVVVFVGWFIERKGPQRVAQALQKVGGINSIFIGKGEQAPLCDGIFFKGTLPHNEIPKYLSSADVFVLPTLHEGCCNAVIEALACGLPVISSDLPFNWDVLDNSNSILVDPNNIDAIADAIRLLRDDKVLYENLSNGALEKAKCLSIDLRAKAILDFCESKQLEFL